MNKFLVVVLVLMTTGSAEATSSREQATIPRNDDGEDSDDDYQDDDRFDFLQDEINQLNTKIRDLESKFTRTDNNVAFAAKLSQSNDLVHGAAVVFDTTIANVGNAYNARTGIFKAPVSGVYFFTVTILSATGSQVHARLKQNDVEKCAAFAKSGYLMTGSCEAVLKLSRGDAVKITAGPPGVRVVRYDDGFTMFSGFLISAN